VFRATKDAALAFAGRTFLNGKLRGIGEVTDLTLDTKRHAFAVRLHLLGEAEPIDVQVNKFVIKRRGDEATLTVLDATASRQWLDAVLRQFVIGQSFVVPPKAEAVLKVLV